MRLNCLGIGGGFDAGQTPAERKGASRRRNWRDAEAKCSVSNIDLIRRFLIWRGV